MRFGENHGFRIARNGVCSGGSASSGSSRVGRVFAGIVTSRIENGSWLRCAKSMSAWRVRIQ